MYKNYLYAYLKHTSLMLELSLTVNLPTPTLRSLKRKPQSSLVLCRFRGSIFNTVSIES